jgi:hypothetical protein
MKAAIFPRLSLRLLSHGALYLVHRLQNLQLHKMMHRVLTEHLFRRIMSVHSLIKVMAHIYE